jgi:hypothetical protein
MRSILFISCCMLVACQPTPPKNRPALDEDLIRDSISVDSDNQDVKMEILFTLEDAEKILGEPATLEDSSTSNGKNGDVYQSSYKALSEEASTKKTGIVYFLVTKFANEDFAKRDYSSIKTANQHNGIEELNNLGNEAYFHTDNENFYYIMVRKGLYGFRIKVNKITGNTSKDAFMKTAEKITAMI